MLECAAILIAASLACLFSSPRALRSLAAYLLAQACAMEYLYEEIAALASRTASLRSQEHAFYRQRLELDKEETV